MIKLIEKIEAAARQNPERVFAIILIAGAGLLVGFCLLVAWLH